MSRQISIKAISNSPLDKKPNFSLDDEWVCLVNEGTTTEYLENWILLNCKPDNKHYFHYYFPAQADGHKLEFKPGQQIYVITGAGKDMFTVDKTDNSEQFFLYQNRKEFIWNHPGDRVYLYSYSKDGSRELYELVTTKEVAGV